MTTEKTKAPDPKAAAPATGTSVALREEEEAALLQGAPQDRQRDFLVADALRQARRVRAMASVVAATEWGAGMSPQRQAAFARYCLELGADPLRHVDLLGGNPFPNGDYYRDAIAASEHFERIDPLRWIHDDPRLRLCALCGKEFADKPDHGHGLDSVTAANTARLEERITRAGERLVRNATELSPAICVLTLRYRNGRGPFTGIGEVHPGKTARGSDRDPIGLEHPRATAETRAWREAGEQAEPVWFRTHASTLAQAESRLKQAYAAERAAGPAERPSAPAPVEVEHVEVQRLPAPEDISARVLEDERDDRREEEE